MNEKGMWNQDWIEIQQKYWEGLTEMGRKAMGLETPKKSPWENALDHWWQTLSPGIPDPAQGFMQRMLDQGKVYFKMAEQVTNSMQGMNPAKDWPEAINKTFQDMQQAFTGDGQGLTAEMPHKMMAFWELPLDNWQRMVSSLSLVPGDMLRNIPHSAEFERFLSAPGLGYTREEQAQQQQMIRMILEYQGELQAYTLFFSNLGTLAIERMREKVSRLSEEGKVIDSARALYDLWVVSCEEVYGEQVMTPQYAKIHGQLVNATMALKKHLSQMVDENLGALNMPTRSEIRTLQNRLQETRRENKQLRHDLEDLRVKLESLQNTATAVEPPRKAVAKKKTVKKSATAKRNTNSNSQARSKNDS
jgi:class III poly(R)-hydroxyalkanoic acid synthase PhaE subunit